MTSAANSVPGYDPADRLSDWPTPPTYPKFAPVRGVVVQDYTKGDPVAVDDVTDLDLGQRLAAGCLVIPSGAVEIAVHETAWDPGFEGSKVLVGFSTSLGRQVIRIPVGTHVIAFAHVYDKLLVRAADNPGVDLTKVRIRSAMDFMPDVAYKFAMYIVGMEPGLLLCSGVYGPLSESEEQFRPRAPLAELVPGLSALQLSCNTHVHHTASEKILAALEDPDLAPKLLPRPGYGRLGGMVMVYGDGVARTTRVVRDSDYDAMAKKLQSGHPDVRFVATPLERPVYASQDQRRAEYDAWRTDLLAHARELDTRTKGRFMWHTSSECESES
jgi:hypothetical protein